MNQKPSRIVILDIDGLRRDVFQSALEQNRIPNLARLLGGPGLERGLWLEPVSTAPSITYCAQATTFTGAHPRDHWVPGNQFFDRFGRLSKGQPRHYAFDVGEQLDLEDALRVFREGLAAKTINPDVETLYETAARHGLKSTVVYNMYARGAETWIKPGPEDWKTFISFKELFLISSEKYDRAMLNDARQHLQSGARPDLLTLYIWGLDHTSHSHGPDSQAEYLTRHVDRQVGDFLAFYESLGLFEGTLFIILSDHGQIGVRDDDEHSLRLGFPFDRELGHFFSALGLDVHDIPGEDPNCDALITMNGGLAHVYLQHRQGRWQDAPRCEADVMPVAAAFWEAVQTGKHCPDLRNGLAAVLVRDAEHGGWNAPYQAYTPEGLVPVEDYLARRPDILAVDAANRLRNLVSPVTGDIVVLSNYADGYFFSVPYKGMHGGLHPDDSHAVLAFGLPRGTPAQLDHMRSAVSGAIADRCRAENGRLTNIADMAHGLRALMGWL